MSGSTDATDGSARKASMTSVRSFLDASPPRLTRAAPPASRRSNDRLSPVSAPLAVASSAAAVLELASAALDL